MSTPARQVSGLASAATLRARLNASDAGIPVLPALAERVIAQAAAPDTPVWRIAGVVSKDQVLASRLLGLANSAYCAPLSPIATVTEAIVRMGTAAVRNLVVTVCFTSRMYDQHIYGPHGQALVEHGLGTAYLARLVAERGGVNPEEAFLYGLLHDIGKLVILKAVFDESRRSGARPPAPVVDQVMAEEHAGLGARVLERWQLPREIVEPVAWHHHPDCAPTSRCKALVAHLADRLSHRFGFGVPARPDALVVDDPYAREIGLDEAWLADIDAHAPGLVQVAKSILA